jgi:site-specific DNA-methyltransferase (adenine-specific)
MLEPNKIYCWDNIDICKQIDDNSIDLIVTSPPYDNLRTYNWFTWDFEWLAKELYRITKDWWVVVWVVGDATINWSETGTSFRQALYFKEIGFNLHDTMIYAKQNPIPQNHNRYEQQREYMFIFSKWKPKTFNVIKEDCKYTWLRSMWTYYKADWTLRDAHKKWQPIKDKKPKTNIRYYWVWWQWLWHPAIFPEKLAEDHIISRSNEWDIVFDPFMWSWTTAKMAKMNNRKFIGCDISQEYVDIANKRLETTTTSLF